MEASKERYDFADIHLQNIYSAGNNQEYPIVSYFEEMQFANKPATKQLIKLLLEYGLKILLLL